jgi:hypothetical protein
MLFVPTPRYSLSSRRFAPSMATTPIPIGPGFPEQAPSVHSSSAAPPADADGDGAAPFVTRGFLALPATAALGLGAGGGAPPPSSGSKFPAKGR